MNYQSLKEKKLNLPITIPPEQTERVDSMIDFFRKKECPHDGIRYDENRKERSFYSKRRSELFSNFRAGDYRNPVTIKSIMESLTNLTKEEYELSNRIYHTNNEVCR